MSLLSRVTEINDNDSQLPPVHQITPASFCDPSWDPEVATIRCNIHPPQRNQTHTRVSVHCSIFFWFPYLNVALLKGLLFHKNSFVDGRCSIPLIFLCKKKKQKKTSVLRKCFPLAKMYKAAQLASTWRTFQSTIKHCAKTVHVYISLAFFNLLKN